VLFELLDEFEMMNIIQTLTSIRINQLTPAVLPELAGVELLILLEVTEGF